jgi:predicted nuclease of predicted toxin-antitoxin system
MRILLDECLPKDLARKLPGHAVTTVPQAGWASINNGELLRLVAASGRFDIFLTVDKRLPQQNKVSALPFAIVLLRAQSNRTIHIFPFAPEILRRLVGFQPGHVYVLTQPD